MRSEIVARLVWGVVITLAWMVALWLMVVRQGSGPGGRGR